MSEFLMPSLGADMEAGTLIEWLAKPGDRVKHGDIIAVVETQKGAIEIEIFEDGILEKYLVEIGKKVPVGTALAKIKRSDEAGEAVKEIPEPVSLQDEGRIRITPAARRLAEESSLDPASFPKRGSGQDGAITLADVEAMIAKKPPAAVKKAQASEPAEMSGMRGAIAAAMSRSKRDIPHYYLAHTIDLSNSEKFITDTNVSRPPEKRLLMGALYLKAVAKALDKFPEFNGHFADGCFKQSAAVHIGMAIKLRGGGLIAPAVHDVSDLELDAVMSAMRGLVARVRAGRFRSSEIADATITISSLGDRGVDSVFGVIYPPQVALIGFGTPSMRPWVAEEKVQARKLMNVTLAADHRVSDGHRGALFLNAIDNFLQKPETL